MQKILLIGLILMNGLYLKAQWNPDPTENNLIVGIADKGTTAVGEFATASDGSGGAYVAWVDTRNTGTTGTDIFLTRVLANGTIAPGFTAGGIVVCNAEGTQDDLFLVEDGSGGVVISWRDARSTTTNLNDIYAQRYNSTGNALWAANGVAVATQTYNEQRPTLVLASPTTIGIAWRGTVDGLDLFGNFLNILNGSKILPTDITIISKPNTQSNQVMIPDGAGGFIITWSDGRVSNSQSSIHAQRISAGGAFLWGSPLADGLEVAFTTGNHLAPSMASDGTIGGAVIAFGSTRVAPTDANIYAQRINDLGNPVWTANGVPVVTASGNQQSAQVVRSGTSTIVTWSDLRVASNNAEIFVQSLKDGDGAINWTADGVRVTDITGNQPNSAANGFKIEDDGAGGATIFYDDARLGTTDLNIYAQKVNSEGGLVYEANGAPIASRAGSNQNWPSVVGSEAGNFIIVWRDSRTNTNAELFASMLMADGTLPVTLLEIGATLLGKTVQVQWTSTSEYNLAHYEVERSIDGNSFTTSGSVNARNTPGVHRYSLLDPTPVSGTNFYRIKSVNTDGSFKFSEIVKVQVAYLSDNAVQLYPNPVVSGLNLRLNDLPLGYYQVRIVDNAGRNIETHRIQKSMRTQIFQFESGRLSQGMYRVQVINDKGETVSVQALIKR